MTTRTSNSLFLGVLQPVGLEGVGWYARVLSERDWASQVAIVERFIGLGFTKGVSEVGGGKITLDRDDRLFSDPLPAGETTRVEDQQAIWQIMENGIVRAEFLAEDLKEDVLVTDSGLRTTEISGRGIGAVLEWAKVLPEGLPVPSRTQRDFKNEHPMAVWSQLLWECQNEGYLTFVSTTFDAITDSAGNEWADTVDLSVSAGEDLLDLLTRWCDAYGLMWKMNTGFILEVRPESASRHLESSVIFTAYRDQTEHSRMVSRREIANVVYTETSVPAPKEGQPDGLVVAIASDGTSQTKWRKRALWLTSGDAGGSSAASAVANATLGLVKDEKASRTIKVDPSVPGRIPFEDFDVSDWIAVELEAGASDSEARRVMALSVDVNEDGYPAVELTLQSRFEARQIKLQRAVDKLGGSTSSSSASTPIPVSGALAKTRLLDLADVDVTGVTSGKVLTYDGAKWTDQAPAVPPVPSLDTLTDVDTVTVPPSDGQALVFDSASGLWEPGTVSGSTPALALNDLTDVATAGQGSGKVLTFDGSQWGPAVIPAILLDALSDVATAGAATGYVLTYSAGAWTPQPVPAPSLALDALTDVATAGQSAGKVLTFNGSGWEPQSPAAVPSTLDSLTDVAAPAPADAQVLTWDAATGLWKPAAGIPGPEGPAGPAGHNPITVSASAPSSPVDGDIWFDIS